MQRRSILLILAVCGVFARPDLATGGSLPDHALGLSVSASELELQRVPSSPLELQGLSPSALNGDYSHAIYAGQFAQQLDILEKARNEIYVDFISSGFTGPEVPRELPSDLQMLSRTAPTPLVSPLIASVSRIGPVSTSRSRSSSSFVNPSSPGFPSQTLLSRRVNRQDFVRDTTARGFPFVRTLAK
ncbi:uncharacterized protein [Panulirus ornatus]|uniref:uncharacterized protein n=1 Tax=Panulirus ornatus TaxID=150431 RepID=UPI003A85907B